MFHFTKKKCIVSVLVIFTMTCGILSTISLLKPILQYSKSNILKGSFHSEKIVLYINSYDLTYGPTNPLLNGIMQTLSANNIYCDTEFLNTKEFPYELTEPLNYNSIKTKLSAGVKYDGLIVSDDAALNFATKYQNELFKDIPIIFCGINNPEKARMTVNTMHNITGFYQNINLDKIISAGLKLNSNANKIIAIYDNSASSTGDIIQFREVKYKFPHYQFYEINSSEMTTQEFASSLENIDKNSVTIFMNSCEISENHLNSANQQEKFIIEHTNVPVYRYSFSGIYDGFAGGKVQNYAKLGENAAKLLVEILNGKDINSIPLQTDNSSEFIFNKNILKKFHLNYKHLPRETILLTAKSATLESYKQNLKPIICLALSLLVLAIIFIFLTINEHENLKSLKSSQANLKYLAEHDYLTDLPNRQNVNKIFDIVRSKKSDFAILLIDIDDFKTINDIYTHLCGDEVLRTIANRLKEHTIDGKFFVYRFGGDEFILIYTIGHLTEDNFDLLNILNCFKEPVNFENKQIFVQASVGVINSSEKYTKFYEYIADADIAMYQSKRNGKNQVTFFDSKLKSKIKTNHEIEKVLENAIANDGIIVKYQAQVDAKTNKICGWEALTRLKDSSYSPADFIPVAEDSGLIVKMARIVTEKVIQQMAEWRKNGFELHKISINYSYRQIKDESYVNFLRGLLKAYNISPNLLEIEITESLFIDNRKKAMKLFDSFSRIGVKLALDDFGTGYSSLSYLAYIPVETVKIDKSIVDNYLDDDRGEFIKNIVRLVHSLNKKLTVEGIEYSWQYDILRKYNCDYIQGYIFSKPITAKEVETFRI